MLILEETGWVYLRTFCNSKINIKSENINVIWSPYFRIFLKGKKNILISQSLLQSFVGISFIQQSNGFM